MLVALVYSKCLNTTKANHLRPDTPQDEPVYDRPLHSHLLYYPTAGEPLRHLPEFT